MNDAQITVVGNVAAEPRYIVTRNGTPLLSVRLAATPRRFDRETGLWRDGETMFMTVTCWRSLAANGQEALAKGDPIVVTGRLRLREYDKDGERRLSAEIEATTVGHDLSRGVARFDRVRRSAGATTEDRQEATRLADVWETVDSTGTDQPAPDHHGGPEPEAGLDGLPPDAPAVPAVSGMATERDDAGRPATDETGHPTVVSAVGGGDGLAEADAEDGKREGGRKGGGRAQAAA